MFRIALVVSLLLLSGTIATGEQLKKPLCLPLTELLGAIADVAPIIGGAKMNVLEGKNAVAFVTAAKGIIPTPDAPIYLVVSLVPDNPAYRPSVQFISPNSCLLGSVMLSLQDMNTIRIGAGFKAFPSQGQAI